jgi:membrane protease YdiL (CAAX protease family)
MTAVFVALAVAICAVWLPRVRVGAVRVAPWFVAFVVAAAWALVGGFVTPAGCIALAIVLGLAWAAAARRERERERGLALGRGLGLGAASTTLTALAAVGALALSLHVVPGVGNLKWPTALQLTPDAAAFTPNLNFGKASAGLFLVALLVPRVHAPVELRPIWRPTLAIGVVGAAATVGAALAMGYVRFEPKLPAETAAFLASNLLFTCVAEEAFFRGVLQESLHRLAERAGRPWLHAPAIVLSALVFGAAHAAGGAQYVLLATLGGFTNAAAYARARKVEAGVCTHFMLNAVHFVFFTYPALAR